MERTEFPYVQHLNSAEDIHVFDRRELRDLANGHVARPLEKPNLDFTRSSHTRGIYGNSLVAGSRGPKKKEKIALASMMEMLETVEFLRHKNACTLRRNYLGITRFQEEVTTLWISVGSLNTFRRRSPKRLVGVGLK